MAIFLLPLSLGAFNSYVPHSYASGPSIVQTAYCYATVLSTTGEVGAAHTNCATPSFYANFGSSVTTGNTLVIGVVSQNPSVYFNTPTDTLGDTFVLAASYSASGATLEIWYAVVSSTGTNSITITTGTSTYISLWVQEISGIAPTTATFSTGTGSTCGCSVTSMTLNIYSFALMFSPSAGTGTWTTPTGFTKFYTSAGNEYDVQAQSSITATGSSTISTSFSTATGTWQMLAVTFVVPSTGCGTPPTLVLYCVPVMITNTQSSTTSSNMPEKITVNWNNYNTYLASNVENIVFYVASGTLDAWCESNCTNTATSSTVWVNLGSNTISSSSTITIYLGFYSTTTNNYSPTGDWGAYPTFTGTYAQYDNGANVFSKYWDWSGTSLPSGWTATGSWTGSVSNGLNFQSSNQQAGVYIAESLSNTQDYDNYAEITSGSNAYSSYVCSVAITGGTGSACTGNGYIWQISNLGSGGNAMNILKSASGSYTSIGNSYDTFASSTFYVFTSVWVSSTIAIQRSYSTDTIVSDSSYSSESYFALTIYTGHTGTVQWTRIRSAPPANVMPNYGFESLSIVSVMCTPASSVCLTINFNPDNALPYGQATGLTTANYFTVTYHNASNSGTVTTVHLITSVTINVSLSTTVTISATSQQSTSSNSWCTSYTGGACQQISIAVGGTAGSQTDSYYYYEAYTQTLAYAIIGGGNPTAPDLDYSTFPTTAGSTDSPNIISPNALTLTGATVWVLAQNTPTLTPNPITVAGNVNKRYMSTYAPSPITSASQIPDPVNYYTQWYISTEYSLNYAKSGFSAPTLTYYVNGTQKSNIILTIIPETVNYWIDNNTAWSSTNPLSGSNTVDRYWSPLPSGTTFNNNTIDPQYVEQYYTYISSPQTDGSSYLTPSSWNDYNNTAIPIEAISAQPYGFTQWWGDTSAITIANPFLPSTTFKATGGGSNVYVTWYRSPASPVDIQSMSGNTVSLVGECGGVSFGVVPVGDVIFIWTNDLNTAILNGVSPNQYITDSIGTNLYQTPVNGLFVGTVVTSSYSSDVSPANLCATGPNSPVSSWYATAIAGDLGSVSITPLSTIPINNNSNLASGVVLVMVGDCVTSAGATTYNGIYAPISGVGNPNCITGGETVTYGFGDYVYGQSIINSCGSSLCGGSGDVTFGFNGGFGMLFAFQPNQVYIITITQVRTQDISSFGNWIIPWLAMMLPVFALLGMVAKIEVEPTIISFITITGLLVGTTLGLLAHVVPFAMLILIAPLWGIYIWKAR